MSRILVSRPAHSLALLLALAAAPACGGDDDSGQDDGDDTGDADDGDADDGSDDGSSDELPPTVFVAREGSLISFDIATGDERPGTVTQVTGPVDLQALSDGYLMVNLTGRNEILVVDGVSMLEEARLPSSAGGGDPPGPFLPDARLRRRAVLADPERRRGSAGREHRLSGRRRAGQPDPLRGGRRVPARPRPPQGLLQPDPAARRHQQHQRLRQT